MIRIYGDLKFNVSDIKNIGEKFIIKFYTTSKSVAIKKTDMDIVDGVIKLNWSELATIGRGVLQYELNNITEDADYDDGIYDSTYTGTTEYYIMSDISIDEDDEDTPITEVIADMKNDINSLDTAKQDKLTAGDNITIENNVISATFEGDDIDLSNYYNKSEIDNMEQVVAASLNDLNTRLGTKANTSDVYTKSEVDQAIDEAIAGGVADLTNYYTKSESDAKYATQTVVNEEIAARIAGDGELNTALGTKADKSDTYTKTQVDDALALKQDASTAFSGNYHDLTNKPDLSVYAESADLATVATSGSYDDLSDKPVIPESVTVDTALSDTSENPVQNKVVKGALDAKQDTISDLATIRSGAALGATAYQKPSTGIPASDIAEGVIPTVPTNVSAFTNDAGYLTQHQSLSNYYTKTEIDNMVGDIETLLSNI